MTNLKSKNYFHIKLNVACWMMNVEYFIVWWKKRKKNLILKSKSHAVWVYDKKCTVVDLYKRKKKTIHKKITFYFSYDIWHVTFDTIKIFIISFTSEKKEFSLRGFLKGQGEVAQLYSGPIFSQIILFFLLPISLKNFTITDVFVPDCSSVSFSSFYY